MSAADFVYDGESSSNPVDSDEASEVDLFGKEIFSPASVLRERIVNFKRQLRELSNGSHVEYLKRVEELEQAHRDAQDTIGAWRDYECQQVEEDHETEKQAAQGEYQAKKSEVQKSIEDELSDKRKAVEAERLTMDIAGDSSDFKPRRPTLRPHKRANDTAVPAPEKRTKRTAQIGMLFPVEEDDALSDLTAIFKGKIPLSMRSMAIASGILSAASPKHAGVTDNSSNDTRLADGRLYYDKNVFLRGQAVYVEARDGTRTNGTISTIGQNEFFIRRATSDQRMRIQLTSLIKGKYTLHKRGV